MLKRNFKYRCFSTKHFWNTFKGNHSCVTHKTLQLFMSHHVISRNFSARWIIKDFFLQINPVLFTMNLCQTSITPEWGGNGKDQEEKGVISAKRNYSITGEKRLENEMNLPSSLPYRRKHFKKLRCYSLLWRTRSLFKQVFLWYGLNYWLHIAKGQELR